MEIIFLLGFIIDTIGKILLGITVINVHGRLISEKRIDKKVIKEVKKEKRLGLVGIFMIILGSCMQIIFWI